MNELRLRKEHIDQILSEVRKSHPFEACALLYGSKKGEAIIVEEVVIVPNEERSEVRFSVDPELFYKVYKKMEEEAGKEYIGLFHSHPAPPSPSLFDEERMKDWPGLVWLIYSTIHDEFGAYVFESGKVEKVEIRMES